MRRQTGHRRAGTELDQQVGSQAVELFLARRIVVERLAQAGTAEANACRGLLATAGGTDRMAQQAPLAPDATGTIDREVLWQAD